MDVFGMWVAWEIGPDILKDIVTLVNLHQYGHCLDC